MDANLAAILWYVETGPRPRMLAVQRDGRLWVARVRQHFVGVHWHVLHESRGCDEVESAWADLARLIREAEQPNAKEEPC